MTEPVHRFMARAFGTLFVALVLAVIVVDGAGPAGAETPSLETVRALQRADPARADHIDRVARVVGAFVCPVAEGRVAVVDDRGLNDLAEARRDKAGRLSIHYRLDVLVEFHVPTVVFWLMHECEHHQLGDTRAEAARMQGRARITAERNADCVAIQDMVALDLLRPGDLGKIERDLSALKGGGFYESGPARADHVLGCAERALSEAVPD